MRLQDIPIFCVSLENATSRWKQIESQAKSYTIDIHKWKASVPSDTEHVNFAQQLSGPQKACALSHIRLWEYCLENKYPYVLILEDDALFRHDWIEVLNSKLESLEKDDPHWDSIFLNCSEEILPVNTWKDIKRQCLTGGYLIRNHAMQYLIDTYKGKWACADWMTQVLQERGHSYSIFPWLVIQDGSPSFIQQDNSPDYQKVCRLLSSVNYSLENYKPKSNRISWPEYFSQLSLLVSKRSPCNRLHVGCTLVKENHIISTGYNGFLPGADHISLVVDNHEQATVHAEQNCIADCAKRGVSTQGAHAYITHYPCPSCYKSLVAAGITQIFYIHDYNNSPIVSQLIQYSKIPVTKIE
jgi:dCMP deaminase